MINNSGVTSFTDRFLKVLLAILLLMVFMYYTKVVTAPLALAGIIALALYPLSSRLERLGMKRFYAVFMVIMAVFLVLSVIAWVLISQINQLAGDLPTLQTRFEALTDKILLGIEENFHISYNDQIKWLHDNSNSLFRSSSSLAGDALNVTSDVLELLGLLPFYVFFMLYYRGKFAEFILQIYPGGKRAKLMDVLHRIKEVVKNYLIGFLTVMLIVAVLNSVGIWIVGIKYAFFFGVVAAFFTIIPYLGLLIGGGITVLAALLTKDSPWYAVATVGVFAVVQFLEGNFITPRIVGSKVNINTFAAILGFVIFGKLWGILGMIIAIPLLGVLKIVFSQIEELKPLAILLDAQGPEETKKRRRSKKHNKVLQKE